ncbi:FHA domain-containing protein [Corallococcus macrosporus]|uniref:FHA domain-containing protein n=1 Tax=Myxococcus fulvus (strain ATCC BAA-855 / HW-1) TaxID=483219 RepID=F8C7U8_MYXFH|nr:FHA domain-containing protein [Corallococcus macrosporus]AEI65699.1 FHA domain-containing protein [Corallococcus macrosporus]
MKRIRQTIEVSEPLWRALELMSRDMGVDQDALVAQALFQLARQNGYVSPTVVPLGGEAQGDAGVATAVAPVAQAGAPVAVAPGVAVPSVVVPVDSAMSPVVSERGAPVVAEAPAPVVPPVASFSADEPTEDPTTESGATSVPQVGASVPSTEMVLARMQEILSEVEASVQPSEGLPEASDDDADEDSDDSDEDSDDADEEASDAASDEDQDDDADEEASDAASDEDQDDDADEVASDAASDEDRDDAADAEASADEDSDVEASGDSEPAAGANAANDARRLNADVSSEDIAEELAALGIVDASMDAALPEAPVATPVAARPLVARPTPKIRLPDEAATILEDQSAEATNIVKAPAPLEVFVQWAQGTPVAISTERFTIGRGPRCNLVVRSERVSREHAVVTRVGDEVFIEDLNSSNGTWLNNERITRHQVSDGDEYMLGTEAVSFTMRPAGG